MYDKYEGNTIQEEYSSYLIEDDVTSYCNKVLQYPLLTKTEERNLIISYQENHDMKARDKLILSMGRWVIHIAKKYQHYHFSLMDAIQDGNMGLLYALDKFDVTRDVRFSTYATYWIRHYIVKGTFDSNMIKIPENHYADYQEILRVKRQIESDRGYEISKQELATILEIPIHEIEEILHIPTIVSDEEEFYQLPDNSFNPESFLDTSALHDVLLEILDEFQEDEKNIIIQKYGLEDGIPKTDEELSDMYHCSISQIRKMEEKALRKMKSPKVKKRLKYYL